VSQRQADFVTSTPGRARAAEAQTGIPATFMVSQAAHETGWGKHEIKNADGSPSFNLFGIKAGANWKGKVAEVTTTEYVDGQPRKVTAKFRAYDSYAESFATTRSDEGQPALQPGRRERRHGAGLRAGPAARGLRHRPGLCRQADARDQHDAAPATQRGMRRNTTMSGSALMSLGTRALFANYAALQTTGNNISNANTKGYSRRRASSNRRAASSAAPASSARASNVTTVARAHDEFLTREAATRSRSPRPTHARSRQLKQLETVFATGERAWAMRPGSSSTPSSTSPTTAGPRARQVVLAAPTTSRRAFARRRADRCAAGRRHRRHQGLDRPAVNTLAQRVADINAQITLAQGSGHQPNDLLDQRDQLISEISSNRAGDDDPARATAR
jgi:flagellar basal body rod protein FlgB